MHRKSLAELRHSFITGEVSAEKIVSHFLKRIEKYEGSIDSLLSVFSERALKKAHELDKKRKEGKALGKLAAIPVIIKDNIQIKGEKTTCASKFLEHYRAPFDATVTKRIEEEDGIILGKSNMDEFAMGSSTENSAFQKTLNPWNTKCTPGGSSGGSAAAVAAMLAPISLGSDTGGSIRQPASFCGLYGFKPTYGRVSRFGLVAFASSLDQIGPFARNVEDIALMQEVIAHPCKWDSTSVQEPTDLYLEELKTSIQGKTLGIPKNLLKYANTEVRSAFDEAMNVYRSLGVKTTEIDLKMADYNIPVYYILASAEASANLARFDGVRYTTRSSKAKTLEEVYNLSRSEGFGKEVKQRILLGTFVLSAGYQDAYYRKAQKVRTLLIKDYENAFTKCDLIAMPTAPSPAFELGSFQDPLEMYGQDIFTISANLAGIPALSMPIGFSKSGLPMGMQLQGPQLQDAKVLRFAHHYAQNTDWHKQTPPLFSEEARV